MPDHQQMLCINFAGFWRTGGGRSSGYHLDTLCERDHNNLPYFPARQLKGILRQALARAEAWGWLNQLALPPGPCDNWEELLFGSRSQSRERSQTWPGMLIIDNANLAAEERAYLSAPEQVALREQLFDALFATAIDESGSAREASLRGAEVTVPLQLFSCLSLQLTALETELHQQQRMLLESGHGWDAISSCLSLVDALGAGRSRGLGEAQVNLLSSTGEQY